VDTSRSVLVHPYRHILSVPLAYLDIPYQLHVSSHQTAYVEAEDVGRVVVVIVRDGVTEMNDVAVAGIEAYQYDALRPETVVVGAVAVPKVETVEGTRMEILVEHL